MPKLQTVEEINENRFFNHPFFLVERHLPDRKKMTYECKFCKQQWTSTNNTQTHYIGCPICKTTPALYWLDQDLTILEINDKKDVVLVEENNRMSFILYYPTIFNKKHQWYYNNPLNTDFICHIVIRDAYPGLFLDILDFLKTNQKPYHKHLVYNRQGMVLLTEMQNHKTVVFKALKGYDIYDL